MLQGLSVATNILKDSASCSVDDDECHNMELYMYFIGLRGYGLSLFSLINPAPNASVSSLA